jgi:hypothetical protein
MAGNALKNKIISDEAIKNKLSSKKDRTIVQRIINFKAYEIRNSVCSKELSCVYEFLID